MYVAKINEPTSRVCIAKVAGIRSSNLMPILRGKCIVSLPNSTGMGLRQKLRRLHVCDGWVGGGQASVFEVVLYSRRES